MNQANEKFLERGLGRNLFSKRFSPDYFFECALVDGEESHGHETKDFACGLVSDLVSRMRP